jgi:hypothetical protein
MVPQLGKGVRRRASGLAWSSVNGWTLRKALERRKRTHVLTTVAVVPGKQTVTFPANGDHFNDVDRTPPTASQRSGSTVCEIRDGDVKIMTKRTSRGTYTSRLANMCRGYYNVGRAQADERRGPGDKDGDNKSLDTSVVYCQTQCIEYDSRTYDFDEPS